MKKLIVAIDGPSGAGKSTASKMLAKRLGFLLINTGLLYRGVAYLVKLFKSNDKEAAKLANIHGIFFDLCGNDLLYKGRTITQEVIDDQMSMIASTLSKDPEVREEVNIIARDIARKSECGIVTEGRDTCTVLFPDADIKIYMTAELNFRANMRYVQLKNSGVEADYEEVRRSIMQRDEQDMNRAVAPLTRDPDAILIDTSHMQLDFVVSWLYTLVEVIRGKPAKVTLGSPVSEDTASLRVIANKLGSLDERLSLLEDKLK